MLVLAYLVVLHISFLLLLWRSDTADEWRRRLDSTPAHQTSYRADRLVFHHRGDAALPAGGWRLFGDSITEGLPTAAFPVSVTNYGVGSDDTVGLRARLTEYSSLARADGVMLLIGLNDLSHDAPATILPRYEAVVDGLPEGIRVVCHGVLPVDERARPDPGGRTNHRIRELNSGMETVCAKYGHKYLAPPTVLSDASGNLHSEFHDGDGIHLNAAGYAAWLPSLETVLRVTDATDPDRP